MFLSYLILSLTESDQLTITVNSSPMPSSTQQSSSPPSDEESEEDYLQELQEYVDRLLEDPEKEPVGSEIQGECYFCSR